MDRGPRLTPLSPEEWTDQAKEVVFRNKANKAGVGKGGVPNVLATLARHPRLLRSWYEFAGYVLTQAEIPARDREIVILRTGWLCRSPYEWGQHVLMGRQAGLDDAEIARLREEAKAPGWTPFEAALIAATDQLHQSSMIDDATWGALRERYDERQMLDLVFTVGQYHLIAMALNSLRVELDEGLQGLEKP